MQRFAATAIRDYLARTCDRTIDSSFGSSTCCCIEAAAMLGSLGARTTIRLASAIVTATMAIAVMSQNTYLKAAFIWASEIETKIESRVRRLNVATTGVAVHAPDSTRAARP